MALIKIYHGWIYDVVDYTTKGFFCPEYECRFPHVSQKLLKLRFSPSDVL